MQANDYQKEALRTASSIKEEDLILNGALGLSGESGEVADIIKKYMFQGHELDKEKLIDELGDVCWYIAILAKGLNVELDEVLLHNVEKLRRRYPKGFNAQKSINRDEASKKK